MLIALPLVHPPVSEIILIVCLCIIIVPAGTLWLPWLRFFRAFSSIVRQMPGYNSQRRGMAHTLPKMFVLLYVLFVLCRSVHCLCVNVHCITATEWQPNCSLTSISYSSSVATCCQQSSCDHMFTKPSWLFRRYLP